MQQVPPTLDEIQAYFRNNKGLSFGEANISLVGGVNHLTFRADDGGCSYALRTLNPIYRSYEWLTMEQEFELLRWLRDTELAPYPRYLCKGFRQPILVQDWVEATCLKAIKPLREEHLVGVARAIAKLNRHRMYDDKPEFIPKVRVSFWMDAWRWRRRLCSAWLRRPYPDVFKWVEKIWGLVQPVRNRLAQYDNLFKWSGPYYFHFDGAHIGNTYWQEPGKVVFLDWQKVSLRNDPTFTLVRFMTSAGEEPGVVSEKMFNTLVEAYLSVNKVRDFYQIAFARLLERLMSDLVWVLWDYTRSSKSSRLAEAVPSLQGRYDEMRRILGSR